MALRWTHKHVLLAQMQVRQCVNKALKSNQEALCMGASGDSTWTPRKPYTIVKKPYIS